MQEYDFFTDFEPVLTAAQMRATEDAAISAQNISAFDLMERAGICAARAIMAYCGPAPVLVLAGPGNNGGDAYVTARVLREAGWAVVVVSLASPATDAARQAARAWNGETVAISTAKPSPIFVDGLFGTGLSRGLSSELVAQVQELAASAATVVALDFPSGVASDDGAILSPLIAADLTVAFGALKPSHLLHPAAAAMGRVVVADIGLGAFLTGLRRNGPVRTASTDVAANKFQRGHVLVLSGHMPGAGWLSARAAQRAGAGYVTLATSADSVPPTSLVVRKPGEIAAIRADSVVVGPGLGTDAVARSAAEAALALSIPAVLDADVFTLFAGSQVLSNRNDVMTPHEGEFARYFGALPGSKVDRARAAAARSGNVIVLKGADTVVAAPDGRAAINANAPPSLATAGSGDVLAGIIAAHLASGQPSFEAACHGVWRHGAAGARGHGGLVAEDIIELIR